MTERKSQEANTGKCRAGLAWQSIDNVDLDISVIAFGKTGTQLEAAHSRNKIVYNGNIKHSGDNRDGLERGDDEYIDINLENLDRKVRSLVFLVNTKTNCTFQHVKTPKFTLYIDNKSIYKHSFGEFYNTAYLVGALYRNGKVWKFKKFETQCTGKKLSESMPIVIQNLTKIPIYDKNVLKKTPNEPIKTRNLRENEVYNINKNIVEATIGLGWDSNENEEIDVDAGVMLLSEKKKEIASVFHNNLKFKDQVEHSGDNDTGVGEGDDEAIKLNLYKMDRNICYIAIGVWIYSSRHFFEDIKNCFVRLVDHNRPKVDLCRFNLSNGNYDKAGAIIMGYLYRDKNGYWAFKSCGTPVKGNHRSIGALAPIIKDIIKN